MGEVVRFPPFGRQFGQRSVRHSSASDRPSIAPDAVLLPSDSPYWFHVEGDPGVLVAIPVALQQGRKDSVPRGLSGEGVQGMSESRSYSYQVLRTGTAYNGVPMESVWVDVSMYPPGTGEAPTTPKEIWVAYLSYLRLVDPRTEYRLIESTTITTTEVIDV